MILKILCFYFFFVSWTRSEEGSDIESLEDVLDGLRFFKNKIILYDRNKRSIGSTFRSFFAGNRQSGGACLVEFLERRREVGRCVRVGGRSNFSVCQSGNYMDLFNRECRGLSTSVPAQGLHHSVTQTTNAPIEK